MSVVRTVVFPALRLLVWAVIAAALVVLASPLVEAGALGAATSDRANT